MADSTNATRRLPSSRGLLRPDEFVRFAEFDEVVATPDAVPGTDVSRWVDRFWSVRWDLEPDVCHVGSVVPHPTVSLTVERGDGRREGRVGPGVWVDGVGTRRFDNVCTGSGGVVGVKFRPGAVTALTGIAAADLTDRVVTAGSVFDGADSLAGLALSASESAGALAAFVASFATHEDPDYPRIGEIVACVADPTVTRVDDLAERCGLSVRALQRLVRRYVGVGPKWLLARYRLHDAVAALDSGYTGTLADLAVGLGWFDQNHFAREFTAMVGVPPATYRSGRRTI